MMLFPRPNSARALFRRRLAKNMSDIGDLYGKVVTNIENEVDAAEWGREGTSNKNKTIIGEMEGDDVERRREQYRGIFLKVMVSFFSFPFTLCFFFFCFFPFPVERGGMQGWWEFKSLLMR